MEIAAGRSSAGTRSTDKRVWLIGGTSESKTLARALVDQLLPVTVTVTTEAARRLYPRHPLLSVWVGRLSPQDFDPFVRQAHIAAVLDASHPFATEISRGAISACQRHCLPDLRYERPPLPTSLRSTPPKERPFTSPAPSVTLVSSLEMLLDQNWLHQQRVLLILGYRHLAAFAQWHQRAELHARILPR